jgi:transposase
MAGKSKKAKERYLKVPYHILNMTGIGLSQKVLYAHIYSYGVKGCWEANDTLAKMFFVGERTITDWVTKLKKAGCIWWLHPKGRYRTFWAKSHPDVKSAKTLLYMDEEISKEAVISGHAKVLLGRNLPGGIEETCGATRKNDRIQVGRNLLHTNNTTKKDTNRKTTATPPPLPAGGQAPALLEERKKESISRVEQLKRKVGRVPRRVKLTPAEIEQSRQRNIKALLGDKKNL